MPDLFDRLLLLKNSQIFSRVLIEDLRVVAQAMEQRQLFSGDRVFEIGDQGDHLYIVASGEIGISLDPNPESDNYIARLGPGDCFGEMNLLDGLPRSATATVLADAELLSLEKTRLLGLVRSYPDMSVGMLRSLSLRLREANRGA
jgi:CRP-like cAMP-binding protein